MMADSPKKAAVYRSGTPQPCCGTPTKYTSYNSLLFLPSDGVQHVIRASRSVTRAVSRHDLGRQLVVRRD